MLTALVASTNRKKYGAASRASRQDQRCVPDVPACFLRSAMIRSAWSWLTGRTPWQMSSSLRRMAPHFGQDHPETMVLK